MCKVGMRNQRHRALPENDLLAATLFYFPAAWHGLFSIGNQ
jgi:hypothetical protein